MSWQSYALSPATKPGRRGARPTMLASVSDIGSVRETGSAINWRVDGEIPAVVLLHDLKAIGPICYHPLRV